MLSDAFLVLLEHFADFSKQIIGKILELFMKSSNFCTTNHLLMQSCVNPACLSSPLLCSSAKCSECRSKHGQCRKISLKYLYSLLECNYLTQKKQLEITVKAEQQMIAMITKSQQQMTKKLGQIGLPKSLSSVLQSLFLQDRKRATSRDVCNLEQYLFHMAKVEEEKQNHLFEICLGNIQKLRESLQQKQTFLNDHLAFEQIKETKISLKSTEISFLFSTLEETLGTKFSLSLLFRGSDHNFEAQKFHEKCDKIQNTLILLKTQDGDLYAGFNNLAWDSPLTGQWRSDHSSKNCLMTFNPPTKHLIKDKKKAIYCYVKSGPVFGNSDLCIVDGCHQNLSCFTFKTAEDSKSRTFLTQQYEVFKVIF